MVTLYCRFRLNNCTVGLFDTVNTMTDETPCYWRDFYAEESAGTATTDVTVDRAAGERYNAYLEIQIGPQGSETSRSFTSQYQQQKVGDKCRADVNGYATCDILMRSSFNISYFTQYHSEEQLGSTLKLVVYDYDSQHMFLRPIGNVNHALPTSVVWDESFHGSSDIWASHTVDIVKPPITCSEPEVYGTCTFETKFFAAKCQPGEYIDNHVSSSCIACTAGYYCPDGIQMQPCSEGKWSDDNAPDCTPCSPGSYLDTWGAAECLPCEPGAYSASSGSITCQKCDAGYFGMGHNNLSTCDGPCEGGYYCPAGSDNATMLRCSDDIRMVCPPGSSHGVIVPDGYFALIDDDGKKAAFSECSTGHFCKNGVQTECMDMMYQDLAGQSSCKSCRNCTTDEYVDSCGGVNAGTCVKCQYTSTNKLSTCGELSMIDACNGLGELDTSECYDCLDTLNDPVGEVNGSLIYGTPYETAWHGACDSMQVGVKSWVLGVVLGVSLGFVALASLLVFMRTRLLKRREMEVQAADNDVKHREVQVELQKKKLEELELEMNKKMQQLEEQEKELLNNKRMLLDEQRDLLQEQHQAKVELDALEQAELQEIDPDLAQSILTELTTFENNAIHQAGSALKDITAQFKTQLPAEELETQLHRLQMEFDSKVVFAKPPRKWTTTAAWSEQTRAEGEVKDAGSDLSSTLFGIRQMLFDNRESQRILIAKKRSKLIAMLEKDAQQEQGPVNETLMEEVSATVEEAFESDRIELKSQLLDQVITQDQFNAAIGSLQATIHSKRDEQLARIKERRAIVLKKMQEKEGNKDKEELQQRQKSITDQVESLFQKQQSIDDRVASIKQEHDLAQKKLENEKAKQKEMMRAKIAQKKKAKHAVAPG